MSKWITASQSPFHLASDDYEELAEILFEKPPPHLAEVITPAPKKPLSLFGSKTAVSDPATADTDPDGMDEDSMMPGMNDEMEFEGSLVTAAWSDIVEKAKRIRSGGGVRIISVTDQGIAGHVQGDSGVYETELQFVPGTKEIGLWQCSCPWAAYSWGRSGPWKKYEGRMCSHALALDYQAQSEGMFGNEVREDPTSTGWDKDITRYEAPPHSEQPNWRVAAVKVNWQDWGEEGNHTHGTMEEEGTIPTSYIANMPGKMGEVPGDHRNRHGEAWEDFKADIAKNGITNPIFITVDWNDRPYISEGNHRRDAAVELGMEEVPVCVRYFGCAEQQGLVSNGRTGYSFSKAASVTGAVYFHAAPTSARKSIEQEGLRTDRGSLWHDAPGVYLVQGVDGDDEDENYWDGYYQAETYGNMMLPRVGVDKFDIWEVNLDPSEVTAEGAGLGAYVYRGNVPPDKIKRVASMANDVEPLYSTGKPSEELAREYAITSKPDEFAGNEMAVISAEYRALQILDPDVEDLWVQLGLLCEDGMDQLKRAGWDIRVQHDDPYVTAAEMHADLDQKIYRVTTQHSHHPVWDVDTNVAFRVCHDILGHGEANSDFSFMGEVLAYQSQCRYVPENLWSVLFTEVVAQSAYANVHHLFGEQKVGLINFTPEQIESFVGKVTDAPDTDYDRLHYSASVNAAFVQAYQDLTPDEEVGQPNVWDGLPNVLGPNPAANAHDTDLVRSFRGREVPNTGDRVAVYRDLSGAPKSGYDPHSSFSIKGVNERGTRTGTVQAHATGLHLKDAHPAYDEAARQKAIETGKRQVHAYVEGTVEDYQPPDTSSWRAVSYYPDIGDFFMRDTREKWLGSDHAVLDGGRMYVDGNVRVGDTVGQSIYEVNAKLAADWTVHPEDITMQSSLDDAFVNTLCQMVKEAAYEGKGCMIALRPPEAICEALALDDADAEPLDELHYTLVYIKDTSAIDMDLLHRIVLAEAMLYPSLSGEIQGYGQFHNGEKDVLWAGLSSDDVMQFRHHLVKALERNGIDYSKDHPFSPHMTLKYVDGALTELPPFPASVQGEFQFSELIIGMSDSWEFYALGNRPLDDIPEVASDIQVKAAESDPLPFDPDDQETAGVAEDGYTDIEQGQAEATLHDEPEPALPATDGIATEGSRSWLMDGASGGGGDLDIAAGAREFLSKQAVKEFTFAEQQELINEGENVRTGNFEALDLSGTHYEGLEAALQEAEDRDEQILWW